MKSLALRVVLIVFCTTAVGFAQKPQLETDEETKKRETLELMAAKRAAAEALRAREEFAKGRPVDNVVSPFTALQSSIRGTFWRNAEMEKMLDLSEDQKKRMDDIFYQYRLRLVDLTAALQKEELTLEPLFVDSRLTSDEAKIITQIDRIAEARAELEKANSRMLLHIIQVLTPAQLDRLPITGKVKFVTKAPKSEKSGK